MTPSRRFVLGLDTAGRFGSIALAVDGSATAWETFLPGEHSSGISLAAERILGSRSLRLTDLAGLAVSSGPGSFTGLRIGLAWAKGVCLGSGAKLCLVPAHDANAYAKRGSAGRIAVLLPGERGEIQISVWEGPKPALLWGPGRAPEGDVLTALREALGAIHFGIAIAGPDLKPDLRESLARAGYPVPDTEAGPPTAAAVAELGDRNLLAGLDDDPVLAAPQYGRAPNARKPSP